MCRIFFALMTSERKKDKSYILQAKAHCPSPSLIKNDKTKLKHQIRNKKTLTITEKQKQKAKLHKRFIVYER